MKHSFTVLHLILWAITGYINGYNDRDDHKWSGAVFMFSLLLIVVVVVLYEGANI